MATLTFTLQPSTMDQYGEFTRTAEEVAQRITLPPFEVTDEFDEAEIGSRRHDPTPLW